MSSRTSESERSSRSGSTSSNESSDSTTSTSTSDASFMEIARAPEMPSFERIKENVRLNSVIPTKAMKRAKRMVCECTYDYELDEEACGEDCLNRLIMIECNPKYCPCGEFCTNQRFQRAQYAKLDVFKTEKKGWGLRTLEDLESGSFVVEYCGEICSESQFKKRAQKYAKASMKHHYFMKMAVNEIVDATERGNVSRFINHSCEPNCETQKWTVRGELRVGFFAIRRIKRGDEITFDYQFQRYGRKAQKCYCGAPTCRGVIGGSSPLPKQQQQREQPRTSARKRRVARKRGPRSGPLRSKSPDSEDQGSEAEASEEETAGLSAFDKELQDMVNEKQQLESDSIVRDFTRLMLNAESVEEKLKLLSVLQNTMEPKCLKEFLKRQSVKLMKNWLDDMEDVSLQFKYEVLKTLQHLPIASKNTVTEIMPIIEKWVEEKSTPGSSQDGADANRENGSPPPVEEKTETENKAGATEKEIDDGWIVLSDSAPTSEVTSKKDALTSHVDVSAPRIGIEVEDLEAAVSEVMERIVSMAVAATETKTETETETVETEEKNEESRIDEEEALRALVVRVQELTKTLLNGWKDLKMIYRIPKRVSSRLTASATAESARRLPSRNSPRPSPRRESQTHRRSWHDGRRERERRHYDRPRRWNRRRSRSRSRSPSKNRFRRLSSSRRHDSSRRYRHDDDDDVSSPEERHRLRQSENRKASDVDEEDVVADRAIKDMKFKRTFRSSKPIRGNDDVVTGERSDSSTPPDSVFRLTGGGGGGGGGNIPKSSRSRMDAFQFRLRHQIHSQMQNINREPTPQQSPSAESPTSHYEWQPSFQIQVQSHPPSSLAFGGHPPLPAPQLSMQVSQLGNARGGGLQPATSGISVIAQQQLGGFMQPSLVSDKVAPPQVAATTIRPASPSKDVVIATATAKKDDEKEENEGPVSPPPPPLPPGWKKTVDEMGREYYYHAKTRESRWELPGKDEINVPSPAQPAEEVSSTSDHLLRANPATEKTDDTLSSPDLKLAARVAAEIREDAARERKEREYKANRAKEEFRAKVSQVVIHCLNQHYRPDCPRGRIESAEDFKHLARKLTYGVVEKELKQGKSALSLEFTGNTRMKILEFIKNYMKKFGEVYRRS